MTRRTYFVQLPGNIHCQTMHKLQDYFLKKIVSDINHPNIIYAFNFLPTLTFGSREKCNNFSSSFELALIEYIHSKGRQITSVEELYSKEIIDYFINNGIKDFDFMQSQRGGGATYLGPGQRTYFTNLNLKNGKDSESILSDFTRKIDQTMIETVKELLPLGSELETLDKFDLTYSDTQGKHKLGSRGFAINEYTYKGITKLMTKYGLSFHLLEEGLKHFDKIMPCGLSYEEISPISLEGILRRQISSEELDKIFISKFQSQFPFKLELDIEFNGKVNRVYQLLLTQNN